MKIAHISDLHFGRIAHPDIVEVLVDEINGTGVDLVAVSGDLTQRARHLQFEAAAAMLEAFSAPTIVVPGNHDVYAWWYPVARLFRPLGRYRRHIDNDLTPRLEMDGVAVLGINSAHGRTVKGGRIRASARRTMQQFFGARGTEVFKILVVHHHLTSIQALGPHDVARDARRTLETAGEVGVDLVLCGHLHISHVEPVEIVPAKHRVVVASAGTATSSRGRRKHRRMNFYNIIGVAADHFTIDERFFDADTALFTTERSLRFERDLSSANSAAT